MISCPKCGAQNVAGLKVCKRCWTVLEAPASGDERGTLTGVADLQAESTDLQRGPLFGVGYQEPVAHEHPASGFVQPPGHLAHAHRPLAGFDEYAIHAGPSQRATAALILSILVVVLFCLFHMSVPIDITAIIVGWIELGAIRRGAAPRSGRAYAAAGVLLGGLALMAKFLLLLAIWL